METDTYSNSKVVDLARQMVAVKINPEASKAGAATARKYGVGGYPTVLFLDANGKKIDEVVGYQPPSDFLKSMRAAMKKGRK